MSFVLRVDSRRESGFRGREGRWRGSQSCRVDEAHKQLWAVLCLCPLCLLSIEGWKGVQARTTSLLDAARWAMDGGVSAFWRIRGVPAPWGNRGHPHHHRGPHFGEAILDMRWWAIDEQELRFQQSYSPSVTTRDASEHSTGAVHILEIARVGRSAAYKATEPPTSPAVRTARTHTLEAHCVTTITSIACDSIRSHCQAAVLQRLAHGRHVMAEHLIPETHLSRSRPHASTRAHASLYDIANDDPSPRLTIAGHGTIESVNAFDTIRSLYSRRTQQATASSDPCKATLNSPSSKSKNPPRCSVHFFITS